jgi:hypothetical protein
MSYRMIHETTISAGLALEMTRRPSARVLALHDDELAQVSGGDQPQPSLPKDSTTNKAVVGQRAADAADAYLRM